MKLLTAIAGGLAGACALTLLHQAIKKADRDAPHVDELGMEALATGMDQAGMEPPVGQRLYNWTLTGDVIANTMYYSLGALGSSKNAPGRTAILGLLGGLGAVYLPEPLHLSKDFTNRTTRTKFLTVGLYTFGGIVAGTVTRLLSIAGKSDKRTKQLAKTAEKDARKAAEKVAETIKGGVKTVHSNFKQAKAHLLN